MSSKDVLSFVLELIGVLTAWPIILLLVILLFRKELIKHIPTLFQNIKKVSVAGATVEFDAGIKALQGAIDYGAEKIEDKEQYAAFVKEQVKKLTNIVDTNVPRSSMPLKGLRILWVDDNPLNNVYEENYLQSLGAHITPARSTEKALKCLKETAFDLIISDLGRVENGKRNSNAGYELLNSVEDLKIHTPFIFFTVRAPQLDAVQRRKVYGTTNNGNELVSLIIRRVLKASS